MSKISGMKSRKPAVMRDYHMVLPLKLGNVNCIRQGHLIKKAGEGMAGQFQLITESLFEKSLV